jgi:outer membrane receptor protein involved in Fe transport
MKKTITAALSLLFATLVVAQDTGTLKGVVKDKASGETIIGANVVWEKDKSRGAATDFDGNFQLVLPAGKQNVVITSIGYAAKTVGVTINTGATTELTVNMEMESEQLDMVIVSAGKFEQRIEDLTVSVSVIKPDIVQSRGSMSVDESLEQTPGLTIVDSEPQMRGGSGYSFGAGARVMVLVDDLPILSGDAGRPSWGFLPVENLEQIEVIKGASSVLYGSAALNGAINIRTAYPRDKPKTNINLISGFYDRPAVVDSEWRDPADMPVFHGFNFFHSRKIGQWDIVIGGNFLFDNGFVGYEQSDTLIGGIAKVRSINRDPEGNVIDTTFNDPRKEFNNRMRVNMNLRRRSKKHSGLSYGVNFNLMYSRSAGSNIWLNHTTGLFRPMQGAITRTIQTTYNIDPFITYSGEKGARHTLRGRLFYQDNANDNNQENLNYVGFAEYQFAKRFAVIKDFTMTSGIMSQYTYGKANLYSSNEAGDGISTALNTAGYLQLDKKFWNRLNLNGGIRLEYFRVNDRESELAPVFRVGASSMLWKEGYLRGSFGQGFRFPTIAERYINTTIGGVPIIANPDLRPEKSWATEVGLMQGVKIGKFAGYIDFAAFWQEYKDFVEFNAGTFDNPFSSFGGLAFQSQNTGRARVRGFDVSFMGGGNLTPWLGMNVLLGYTYAQPHSLDPETPYAVDNFGREISQVSSTSILYGNSFDSEYPNPTEADTAAFLADPVLKYRFEHLANVDVEFVFTIKKKYRLAVAGTYRYYSFMRSVDHAFYLFDRQFLNWGATDFRRANSSGDHVFDVRMSFDLHENIRLAIIMRNLANRMYALRPLKINEPRTIQAQVSLTF